jgi:fructokinase
MNFNVVGIGEALWDLMPAGRQLGGAPANFACHARSLGANAFVITRVGADNLGREILQRFKEMKIADGVVQIDPGKPTGTAAVTLQEGGVPQFNICEDVAWDWLAPSDAARNVIREADAVCFGSLSQRNFASRTAIQQLMKSAPAEALRIFDINLRQHYYSREIIEQSLRQANVLKLNDAELPVLAKMFDLKKTPREQIHLLAHIFELRLVVLTRGQQGSLLYLDGRWSEQFSQPVRVMDTVGAGDAFTAGLTMGLLNKMDLDDIHTAAALVASHVCSHAGATPALPEKLRNMFTVGDCGNPRPNSRPWPHSTRTTTNPGL